MAKAVSSIIVGRHAPSIQSLVALARFATPTLAANQIRREGMAVFTSSFPPPVRKKASKTTWLSKTT
jgi:hypothetical protein